jgi:hypothetical protein
MMALHKDVKSLVLEAKTVFVQTTFDIDRYRLDFRVEHTISAGGNSSSVTLAADPKDQAYEGFLAARKGVPRANVIQGNQGLKQTWPYIHFLGWDKLVDGQAADDLIGLVELPKRGDPLISLVAACHQMFVAEQEVMELSAHPMIRQQVNDPKDG